MFMWEQGWYATDAGVKLYKIVEPFLNTSFPKLVTLSLKFQQARERKNFKFLYLEC